MLFMKTTWIRFVAAPALASGMLLAQTAPPAAPVQPPAQHRQWRGGRMFDRLAAKLNLTEAQRQQARAILRSTRESSRPIAVQLHQDRAALRDAIKSGKPDAAIDQLSASAGNLMGQLTANRTKAYAKIYAMLTPEQKATADQIGRHFRGMFMGGHEHGHGTGAGA